MLPPLHLPFSDLHRVLGLRVVGTAMGKTWSQSVWIPNPPITEKNVPDQSGKVAYHITT
jgi:hypothetical protein